MRILASALALLLSGCGVIVEGDFDGVSFSPNRALIAVADQNDLLLRGGAVIPVQKNVAGQSLHLLLTAGSVDANRDWRHDTTAILLDIRRELATSDGILLKNVPRDLFEAGTVMVARVEDGFVSGDFEVAMGAGLPNADQVAGQGLGSKLDITLSPRGLAVDSRGGNVLADVEIQRLREAGQDGDIATGTVTISFQASLAPERLGEANLTLAEPILRCMQDVGPSRGAACAEVDALPYVDETGFVNP